MGMVVIGMALGASFGSCFYLGLFFSDMHPCLPFLLLGIGVDDMFVIVQAVENLSASERKLPIDQRVGKAMRHAGVSITVTSVTDMAAFLIGSTSVRISAQWLKTTKMSHFLQNSSNVVSFFNSFLVEMSTRFFVIIVKIRHFSWNFHHCAGLLCLIDWLIQQFFCCLCRVCPSYDTFASLPLWESFSFISLPSPFS